MNARAPINSALSAFFALLAGSSLTACSPVESADTMSGDEGDAFGEAESAVSSSSVPITQENISINVGAYRETMDVGGCTGTVIGPHAVLTAAHCKASGAAGTVSWPASGVSFSHTDTFRNPYQGSAWWPTWWRTLNQEQIDEGIRYDDWPAGHDQAILFVPGLDEAFIGQRVRANDWRPATLAARAGVESFVIVGNSPGGGVRELAAVEFDPATPNDISSFNDGAGCSSNRDGLFSIDPSVTTDPGDSGGPVLGSLLHSWGGGTIEGPRHVVSVNSNACPDVAPAAYDIDVSLTANQSFTVRLNDLWLRAVASDADGDLIPYECDGDPSSPTGSTNACPAPLGGPSNARVPRALLACEPGYVATGIKGTHGWLIDKLAVECTPIPCLERTDLACGDSYWTDHFAGDSAASSTTTFTRECGAGKVLDGLRGRHDAGSLVRELTLVCHDYAPIRSSGSRVGRAELAAVGNSNGTLGLGAAYSEKACAAGSVLVGFEARSDQSSGDDTLRWITGLQPVCRDVSRLQAYHGGLGGDPHELACPEGFVAVGTTQNTTSNGSLAGMFGMLCAEKSKVSIGKTLADGDLVIAHTSFTTNSSTFYPAMVEKYTTFKARQPAGMETHRCSAGFAVDRMGYRAGALVDQITSFRCRQPGTALTESYYFYTGGNGGTARSATCAPGDFFDGMVAQSMWSLDGLAPRCGAY